jgi:hypothetical protein
MSHQKLNFSICNPAKMRPSVIGWTLLAKTIGDLFLNFENFKFLLVYLEA